jgi:ABC-type transport system involved in multi-copper enzyme maturation permease subunit
MFARVVAIAFNTYREAVRARVLHGLFGLALATAGYALVVGAFAGRARLRVVSDLGAASISVYGIVVAIVLGATALYRELELKTIFPILARPLRRSEYLVGKFLGSLLTLLVFIAADTGALLIALAPLAGKSSTISAGIGLFSVALLVGLSLKFPRWRTALPIVWALGLLLAGSVLAAGAPDDRRVLLGSALLTLFEVGIISALATVFSAFSSPFLTALFSFGVFVVGRSADTLANLPVKLFGDTVRELGMLASRVVPNLMLYVPERPLLTGEAAGTSLGAYLSLALLHALGWIAGLLAAASLIFRRRDFL